MDNEKKFVALYEKIFDKEGKIQNCGRECCKEIISLACIIDNRNDDMYGNEHTGFMNVKNLQKLYKQIS